MPTPRRTTALAALCAAALPIVGACSDGDDGEEQAQSFCAEVTAARADFGGDPFEALQSRDPERIEEELRAVAAFYERAAEMAPDDIDTDVARLAAAVDEVVGILEEHDFDVEAADADLQQTTLSDPAELEAARTSNEAIAGWVEANCGGPATSPAPPTTAAQPAG